MGGMNDYLIWLEEKGYVEWDELNGGWIDLKNRGDAWAEYNRTQLPRSKTGRIWSSSTVSDVNVAEDPSIDT
jgi:hypothetical protein